MKKLRILFFCTVLMLCMVPTAFAAQSLTDGGTIVLKRDTTVSKDHLDFTKDTVLDLNGHTLKLKGNNSGISITHGVTVSIYNGVLDVTYLYNAGTIECLEGVTIREGEIDNRGHIGVIRNCEITSYRYPDTGKQMAAIENWGGTIDLIENTLMLEGGVYSGGFKNIFDENGVIIGSDKSFLPRIGTIRNCKIESNRAAITSTRSCIDLVEDCILVSLNDGAENTAFGALELYPQGTINAVRDCVLVGYAPGAVHQWPGSEPVASYENCTFISPRWKGCSYGGFDEEAQATYYLEYPVTNTKNCTFHRLNSVDLDDYTAWEMPPLPQRIPADPGLKNFKTVNPYTPGQFTDVPESHWSSANVGKVYELGLMKGTSDTSFNPTGNVTLAHTITMAARLHSIYTTGSENFVQSGLWYQTYLDYCKANGILKQDFANYNAPAKRSDFATILAAALPAEALPAMNSISSIPDVPANSENAAAIYALYRAGVLTGNDALGTFGPETSISRAAASAILARMAEPALRKNVTI